MQVKIMDNVELSKIQKIELDALSSFLEMCERNNLKVFLRGGSVLGAIKYNGFIPWDDDIDVALPRNDYNRLIGILANTKWNDKFVVHYWKFDETVHSYFPRLALLEEERIKQGISENTDKGLHIMDIIPLDGSPNNYIHRRLFYMYIYFLRAVASTNTVYRGNHKNPHTKAQKIIIKIMRFLGIHILFPQKKIYQMMDVAFSKYQWNKSEYCGTVTASLGMKESMDSSIWGDGTIAKFSGLDVLVPAKYDEYLKILYGGNYMTYTPNENERKSHFIKREGTQA